MRFINIAPIILFFILMMLGLPLFGQVDESLQSQQDTVYLYEEEIVYDTLYVYDSIVPEKMMTKAELLKALCADRGVGTLKYQNHNFYISTEECLIKLDKADLKTLLSPSDYADYRKAKKSQWASTPLWVVGSVASATAILGIYEVASSYYYRFNPSFSLDDMTTKALSKMGKVGYVMFLVGLGVSTFTFKPAANMLNRGEDTLNRLARRFKANSTAACAMPVCTVGNTPYGIGLTLEF